MIPPVKRAEPSPPWGWARLKSWLTGTGEQSLRESIEEVIEQHDAVQKPDGMASAARSMMVNVFEFADLRVEDVMVPRADIVALEEAATVEQAMRLFTEANHSRLPVHRGTLDDLAGMIHIKDLLSFIVGAAKPKRRRKQPKPGASEVTEINLSLRSADLAKTVKQAGLVRELLFVAPSMAASDLLIKMQATRVHMAIVVDEYGGTDGLLSLEDLVEVIVGDIDDEHDIGEEQLIRDLGEGVYLADARAPLDEVEALLGKPLLPEERRAEADTLGGLIFAMLGRVPAPGEIVRHGTGIAFEISESDARRVKKIRMLVDAKAPP
ncbi:MAG: hemolysin family protein, partial [Pseudomonadota bacterium]|nr:hemolysin family protein [Pseudomonadota bacterium]